MESTLIFSYRWKYSTHYREVWTKINIASKNINSHKASNMEKILEKQTKSENFHRGEWERYNDRTGVNSEALMARENVTQLLNPDFWCWVTLAEISNNSIEACWSGGVGSGGTLKGGWEWTGGAVSTGLPWLKIEDEVKWNLCCMCQKYQWMYQVWNKYFSSRIHFFPIFKASLNLLK